MIEVKGVSKNFEKAKALDDVTMTLRDGSIFGLIGSNGSGKSTLLRILSGIYRADQGEVLLDHQKIYENPKSKARFFYISDDQFTRRNASMGDMAKFYTNVYQNYDLEMFESLTQQFKLDPNRALRTFSKGMQRQAHIILGLAAKPKYLFCDETFDGLDPMRRQAVKRIFAEQVAEGEMNVIITSHNLREIEDICDQIGLLHKGEMVLQRNIDDMTHHLHKVQCAFRKNLEKADFAELDILQFEKRGRMISFIARGERSSVLGVVENKDPLYAEILPLTLEEVFIAEMEVRGYDIDTVIF